MIDTIGRINDDPGKTLVIALEEAIKNICRQQPDVLYSIMRGNSSGNLDNCTSNTSAMLSQEDSTMAYKIDRRVKVNGETIRIRANSEQEYAEKILQAMNGPTASPAAPVQEQKHDFAEYAMQWFNTFSKPTIEKATANTYERQLRRYWIPGFSGKAIEDITAADIQSVFNGMTNTAKETKQKAKVVLNMVFEQALEDELVKRNPVSAKSIRLTGRSSKETEPYSVEEMRYIVTHLDQVQNPVDRAYLALQALHPLRLEEVLGLKYEDLEASRGVIHVRRSVTHPDRNQPEIKATKTEASCRDIAFAKDAARYMTTGKPDQFIIGGDKPFSYIQVRHMCDRIRKDIGFNDRITPRRFRTTVLTDIYDATKDIKQAQAAAGHTTAAMTLKHYVKGRKMSSNAADAVASIYGLSGNGQVFGQEKPTQIS